MNSPTVRIELVTSDQGPAATQAPRRVSALDVVAATPWAIESEMLETIRTIALREGDGVEALQAREGRPLTNARTVTLRDGVAVVPITGPIFRYANLFTQISGATSLDVLAKDFAAALDDPTVKAIVLDINSPGGQATGIADFAAQVRAADKPVVAFVGGMAASAAYWIAAAAPQVVMSKSALAGNIGAVLALDVRKDPNSMSIVSSQSPNKRPDATTDAGREQLQSMVDALAQVFIEDVAAFRGMTPEAVVADFNGGDTFIAAKAVATNMADRIGTLEDVIAGLVKGVPSKVSAPGANTRAVHFAKGAHMDLNTLKTQHPTLVGALIAALTLDELKAGNPGLVEAVSADVCTPIAAAAATAERERIFAVEAQAMPGHEALIARLKADGKTTGAEAALQVLAAEKAVLGTHAGDLAKDTPKAVPAAAAPIEGAGQPAQDAPIEERAQAKWDANAKLQGEFGASFATFLAYAKGCEAAGRAW